MSRITEDHLDSVLHPQFAGSGYTVWAKGLGASPGAAVGRIYFTADDAAAAAERGEKVVLVRSETSPEDVHGMLASEGILTARGGLVSHAAVVARGWGKPAVVGAEVLRLAPHSVTVGDVTLDEGDWVSLDGGAGIVVAGQVPLTAASPLPAFKTVLSWADDIRKGHLAVRANADTGEDAANARSLGAEGIGLCRTEHMFLGEDRLPVVRRMILADTPEEETAALEELRQVQREDFIEILAAMDGLPVTVRLLDPPLHEFLPSTEEMAIKEATVGPRRPRSSGSTPPPCRGRRPTRCSGTRGVRLGVVKPGLYAMQVRALMEAARQRVADGGHPDRRDHDPPHRQPRGAGPGPQLGRRGRGRGRGRARPAPLQGGARAQAKTGTLEVTIGTMIETPRAALLAGEIAEVADFFSFGTNDLTQMTFGFSRDDVEGRMMGAYLELGLLKRNPFDVVDAGRRGRAGPPGHRAGPGHPAVAQGRGLRRARRGPRVDHPVLRRRARLRELLPVPGPRGPAGRRPGRAGGRAPGPGQAAPKARKAS